jgi:hypothetical protein
VGGRPEYAVADGEGMIYDNIKDKNEVVALDPRANTVKARASRPKKKPPPWTWTSSTSVSFIGGRNQILAIMDAENGKVLQTFPIGSGVDTHIFEPKAGLLFTAAREGILHVFHETAPTNSVSSEGIERRFSTESYRFPDFRVNLHRGSLF